jgi:cytochrome c-type biogenesis protein CcmE
MTRKKRRAVLISTSVLILSVAVLLVLVALRDTVVFFLTPSEVSAKAIPAGREFRLGGLVSLGSVIRSTKRAIEVRYQGILPDLFREGQGVVAYGKLDSSGRFIATNVLAKHDETYMPPEVAKALKEQGLWHAAHSNKAYPAGVTK